MAKSRNDMYANIASAVVDLVDGSAVFTELQTGISLGQGVGMLIDRIEYSPTSALYNDMQTDGDLVQFGWTTRDNLATIELNDQGVIQTAQMCYQAIGAPTTGVIQKDPMVFEYTPPIIVAAPRIYLAVYSSGVAAGSINSRVFYRYVTLTSQEYLEIAESFILVG